MPTRTESSHTKHAPTKKQRNQRGRITLPVVRRPWWQSPGAVGGGAVLLLVAALVVVGLLGGSKGATGTSAASAVPLPATVVDALTKPSTTLLETVGSGGQSGYLSKLPGTAITTGPNGKPFVVYVGAEYCPFCAAERWSVVMAMARFGSFSNLHESTSSATDTFPNTRTVTFHGCGYSSEWLSFAAVELADGNNQPLDVPSAQVAGIFSSLDQPPYTATAHGFPFLDIGGRFVLSQTSFSPQLLQGKSWQDIATALGNPADPVSKAIVGNANYITAAICLSVGNQPPTACNSAMIQSLEQVLNAQTAVSAAVTTTP
jgi:hypothetical protein